VKIHPVGVMGCSMWTDGQTDMEKLIVTLNCHKREIRIVARLCISEVLWIEILFVSH